MNKLGLPYDDSRPCVVAFGGGKGGVGRSTLAAEVARSLARHNERVLCIDASWSCPTLHSLLHADPFPAGLANLPNFGEEGAHLADYIQETTSRNVWLASLAYGRPNPFVRPKADVSWLYHQIAELDFDWVFLDLPPGNDPSVLNLFIFADIPIIVASPEPASISLSAQFARGAIYQAIGYHPGAYEVGEEIVELLRSQGLEMNRDGLLRASPSADSRRVVSETLELFEPYIVVNFVREGSERDLGYVLGHALHEEVGVFPRFIASVDYEDRRWFFNRRATGTAQSRGEEALSTDIETMARRLTEIELFEAKYPRPVPRGPDVHPALQVGLNPETGRNEIRQHTRRIWEGYRREASLSLVFSTPGRREQIAEKLEQTYRSVLTLNSDSHTLPSLEEPVRRPSPAPSASPKRPAPEIDEVPPTEEMEAPSKPRRSAAVASSGSPGRIIEKLRRDRNMSLQELSLRTHIGIKYLAAIEDVDREVLPRDVYLRGYLREIARIFDIEPAPLIEQYFRFLAEG